MRTGRPKLGPKKKSAHIIVCVTPAEKAAIEGAARPHGQLSAWAREVLLAAAAAAAGATRPVDDAEGEDVVEEVDETLAPKM